MRTRIFIALSSPACLALLSQCATAAPVNEFHQHSPWSYQLPEANHGHHLNANHAQSSSWIGHSDATHHLPGGVTQDSQDHFPLSSTGRRHNQLGRSDFWVHPDLNKMFQEAGLPTVHRHHVASDGRRIQHDFSHEEHVAQSPSHHDNDGLWAIVGESSKKFGDKPDTSKDDAAAGVSFQAKVPSAKKQKGVLLSSNDPNNWRYKLPIKTISAVHAKYRELVGPGREYASLNKYLSKFASQQDALDLLSTDSSIQMNAFHRIGVPVQRSGGARKLYWGDQKNAITKRVELATGLNHDLLVKRLNNRLYSESAEKLMSDDKKTFDKGVKEFLNENDKWMIAGMPTQKRRKTSLDS